jgi:hypothetical protein
MPIERLAGEAQLGTQVADLGIGLSHCRLRKAELGPTLLT